MDIIKSVGPAIRVLRDKAGISQEELAARAELDRTYVSGIERGARNPSVKSLQRVANGLEVGLDEVFVLARKLAEASAAKLTPRASRGKR